MSDNNPFFQLFGLQAKQNGYASGIQGATVSQNSRTPQNGQRSNNGIPGFPGTEQQLAAMYMLQLQAQAQMIAIQQQQQQVQQSKNFDDVIKKLTMEAAAKKDMEAKLAAAMMPKTSESSSPTKFSSLPSMSNNNNNAALAAMKQLMAVAGIKTSTSPPKAHTMSNGNTVPSTSAGPPMLTSHEAKITPRESSSGSCTVNVKEGAEIKLEAGEIVKPTKNTSNGANSQYTKQQMEMFMQLILQQQIIQQQAAMKQNGNRFSSKPSTSSEVNGRVKQEQDHEARNSATPMDHHEHRSKRPPATETQAKMPLAFGWRRQTCVRHIAASGVRGDVIYYAPCGKKLSTYAEVLRYLMKNHCGPITRDNFSFSSKLVVGEFIWPKENGTGETTLVHLSEEEVSDEINRLLSLRPPIKTIEKRHRAATPDELEIDDSFDMVKGTYDDEEKIKWSREPIDDLLLTEIRPMPDLTRIPNVELKGEGFACALQTIEFVNNFAHVLSIEPSSVPTLDAFCAGLCGDKRYCDAIIQLTKTLLSLVLEYPGFPNGKRGRSKLGQSLAEVPVKQENYSELMRLFLGCRDEKGKKLSGLLDNCEFQLLAPEHKSEILAFICDELVCCRNVVREIDGNLEEIGKLRGDRWLREGKARALKTHQRRKRRELKKEHHDDEGEEKADTDSDGSRPGSPVSNKKFTPGLGQVEILTAEEEAMTPEELDDVINNLKNESDNLKAEINDINQRVRALPFGWDRFHRQYWQLRHVPTVIVESIESSADHNPACNVHEICAKDPPPCESDAFIDPEVMATMEDLVDDVTMMRLSIEKRKNKRKVRRMENPCKRGWWQIENREALEAVKGCLHGRGIRERCLHRLLCKNWFMKDVRLSFMELEPLGSTISLEDVRHSTRQRLAAAIEKLEKRIFEARMNVPDAVLSEAKHDNGEDEHQWRLVAENLDKSLDIEGLRTLILQLETIIERRYLRQNFYGGSLPSVARILGLTTQESEENKAELYEEGEHMDDGAENVDDLLEDEERSEKDMEKEDERDVVEIWREHVAEATTCSQLMMTLQCLENSIAWERSIVEAKCQICKERQCEKGVLRQCDGCQMGYHNTCFKPSLPTKSSSEWFCPRCQEQATGKPTCVLCIKQGAPIFPCRKCYNFFHTECSAQSIPDTPSEFICIACESKTADRRVIIRGESEEREVEESFEVEQPKECHTRRNNKRKAEAPPPVIFPSEMNMDLCRTMLDEMEQHHSSGPFLEPVDCDLVPGYKETIESPIDLQTIRNRVDSQCYTSPEDFAIDMDLMFSNCRTFNEDDSPVGHAGITLHKFFQKRWRQVKYNYSKRLKRMRN